MMPTRWLICLGLVVIVAAAAPSVAGQQRGIATGEPMPPIVRVLTQRCLQCHSGSDPQGELDLTRPHLAVRGDDLSENPLDSLLWERVRDDEMPPEQPLTKEEKQILKEWLTSGADGDFSPIDPWGMTTDSRAGRDWWSLQPVVDPEIPAVAAKDRVRNPVDAFLLRTLEARQLSYAPEALPRDQIRRLYFDLTGLPAPWEAIAEFERSPTDEAYQQIVDRLLNSPEYGERWGRHWLDIVRFGESDGFERNGPRRDAWRYRDWVIDALNRDLPFVQFAQWQIAGDILDDDPVAGMAATGFLVAGVHNTVVGSSRQMQLLARQDEMEDLVGAIGQTFLGMTVNCARCHDHKFDPIQQREYYQMVAALAGVNHGTRQTRLAAVDRAIAEFGEQIEVERGRLAELEQPARAAILSERAAGQLPPPPGPEPLLAWEFDQGSGEVSNRVAMDGVGNPGFSSAGVELHGGDYLMSLPLPMELGEKTLEVWVALDDLEQRGGAAISLETLDGAVFDAIVFGEQEPRRWMAGSDGFSRTRSLEGEPEETCGEPIHMAIAYAADGTITAYRNGMLYGRPYRPGPLHTYAANSARALFGLRHSPAGGNRLLAGKLLRARIYDRALSPAEVAASAGRETDYIAEAELLNYLSDAQQAQRREWLEAIRALRAEIRELERNSQVTIYTAVSATPGPTYYLPRGDVMNPQGEVAPGGVAMVAGLSSDFGLSGDAPDSERRLQLARWITSPQNPLFGRVIVNRLWHYHFGTGLIATPNDFGFSGGLPSHPELLDWLVGELRGNGYRLKSLHRTIVTSTAYRQSSKWRQGGAEVDAENRLLWRRSPVRLDAEVIRDSILAISGKLNRQRGGPGYEDVRIVDENNGTTYYFPFDRDDPALDRRTVYRFNPRGGRSALLDAFDCPDPSTAAPRRSVTTTPLQALSLLNNDFILRMAGELEQRAVEADSESLDGQLDWMFRTALGRPVRDVELEAARSLARDHGLRAVARALFNSNEFIIVQ